MLKSLVFLHFPLTQLGILFVTTSHQILSENLSEKLGWQHHHVHLFYRQPQSRATEV
jgi:hypothetical protein